MNRFVHVCSRLVQVARPALRPLGASAAGRLLGHAVSVAIFAVGGWAAGSVIDGNVPNFWTVAAILAGLAIARGALSYLEHYFGHLTAFRVLDLFRRTLFDSLVRQAPLPARTTRSGDLLTVVTKDVDRLEVFFAHTLVPLTAAAVMPAVFAAGFASVWGPLGIVAGVSYALCLLIPALTSGSSLRHGERIAQHRAEVAVIATDTVQAARDVLGYQAGPARIRALLAPQREAGTAVVRKGWADGIRQLCITILPLLATLAGAMLVLPQAAQGSVSWAAAFAVIAALMPSHVPVTAVEETMAEATVSWASAQRVVAALDSPVSIPEVRAASALSGAGHELTFDAVSLGYSSGPHVVKGVSFALAEGSIVAVVGPTGSGKSTLAAAAARLLDPAEGSVRLNGIDLRELPADYVREQVVMVPQRVHLFDGAVRDNLLLAEPGAQLDELEQACERAGLLQPSGTWDVSQGLNTRVGARGTTVSGGQRQRIGIARGFLRTSTLGVGAGKILVLDEATSDLDPRTQTRITEALREHRAQGGSALVIAHRLSTVTDADQIVYLENGEVLEKGTHEQLLQLGGQYSAAWKSQLKDR